MSITQVGNWTNALGPNGQSSGTATLTLPSGIQVGDYVFVALEVHIGSGGTAQYTDPTNGSWTPLASVNNGTSSGRGVVYYKQVTSNDVGQTTTSITFSHSSGGQCYGIASAVAYRGITSLDKWQQSAVQLTIPAISITKASTTLLTFPFHMSSTGANYGTQQQFPSGYTHVGTNQTNQYGVVALAGRTVASPATVGGETWPSSNWGSSFATIQVALTSNTSPTAPTPQSPADGVTWDSSADQTVTFQHNDPDGDAASAWRVRYRPAGTTVAYAYLTGTTTASNGATITAPVPANTWDGVIEYAEQTYDPSGAEGAWSPTRVVTGVPAALAALTGGQGGSSLDVVKLYDLVQSERALRAQALV